MLAWGPSAVGSMQSFSEHRLGSVTASLWRSDAVKLLLDIAPESVDLIVTSPPYFIGKSYDTSQRILDFLGEIRRVIPPMIRCLKLGGSLCWQVGNHVDKGEVTPLDVLVVGAMDSRAGMVLRNRIIWTFGHGMHASKRFSGRHETILWYTKGSGYYFDLDGVRVPQSYPGKRHYKGPNRGDWSGHPLGKNPGDVWDVGDVWEIPNVKANHIEKTAHPCQFPSALVQRLIRALSPKGGLVLDPYVGSGTSGIAALLEGRRFIGGDVEEQYLRIARDRFRSLERGRLRVRPDVPVHAPTGREGVTITPPHFRFVKGARDG